MPRNITDPVEKIVARALDFHAIDFLHESENKEQRYFLGWVDSWQSAGLGAVIVIGFVVFAAVGAIIANEEEMHR
jgi:hypothetical protein